jgi:predicted nucleic acid-binding protein
VATKAPRARAALKPQPLTPLKPQQPPKALTLREPGARYLTERPPFAGPVLADSGPLIALFNAADHWHAPVLAWLQRNPRAELLSTWPVATEVCALLAARIHNDAALDFLRWAQRGGLRLQAPVEGSITEVLRLSERFADLPFDLADASIAEAAARLKVRQVLSIDADFDVYRDRNGRALVNLLR